MAIQPKNTTDIKVDNIAAKTGGGGISFDGTSHVFKLSGSSKWQINSGAAWEGQGTTNKIQGVADTNLTQLLGGTAATGGGIYAYGSTHATKPGKVEITAGSSGSSATVDIATASAKAINFLTNNLQRAAFDTSGNLAFDGTNGGNITFAKAFGSIVLSFTSSVSAAGVTQGTATALNNVLNNISGGSGGVILPAIQVGVPVFVFNTIGTAVNVYPDGVGANHTIGAGGLNSPLSLPSHQGAIFVPYSSTAWAHFSSVTF